MDPWTHGPMDLPVQQPPPEPDELPRFARRRRLVHLCMRDETAQQRVDLDVLVLEMLREQQRLDRGDDRVLGAVQQVNRGRWRR